MRPVLAWDLYRITGKGDFGFNISKNYLTELHEHGDEQLRDMVGFLPLEVLE